MKRKGLSKKLLVQFLKKEKLMGNAILYTIAKPYGFQDSSNIERINKYCECADSCKSDIIRAIRLKSIWGSTIEPSYTWLKNKDNFGYCTYKKWAKYLNDNINKINEYYKSNETIR